VVPRRFGPLPHAALALLLLFAAGSARASFLHGETLDKAADWLAIFVLILVPVVGIVAFWLVHILPEKIAEKRHHPQKAAITTLCLLSLVFGGLLWPIAWLWAYTRPIGYRMAYGTDKHEDYFEDMAGKARAGGLLREELAHLREELDEMAARGALPPALKGLRAELDELRARAQAAEVAAAAPARTEEKR
jgi:CBS domain containing-hemolysin-like protein